MSQIVISKEQTFSIGAISLPPDFSESGYVETYRQIFDNSYKYAAVTSAPMAILGSTIFPTHRKYSIEGEFVPRVNACSKKGTAGWKIMQMPGLIALAKSAEAEVEKHLRKHDRETLEQVLLFKNLAPENVRFCGTFFNAMALVGDLRDGFNHKHKDKNDLCSIIVMLGAGVEGGGTLYYNDEGKEVHREPFEHGKSQVGPFHQVLHSGEQWKGPRGILTFYTSKKMYQHFKKYGCELLEKHSGLGEKQKLGVERGHLADNPGPEGMQEAVPPKEKEIGCHAHATDQEVEEEVIGAMPSAEKGDAINVVELQEPSVADSGGSVSQDQENTGMKVGDGGDAGDERPPSPAIAVGLHLPDVDAADEGREGEGHCATSVHSVNPKPSAPAALFSQHEVEAGQALAALAQAAERCMEQECAGTKEEEMRESFDDVKGDVNESGDEADQIMKEEEKRNTDRFATVKDTATVKDGESEADEEEAEEIIDENVVHESHGDEGDTHESEEEEDVHLADESASPTGHTEVAHDAKATKMCKARKGYSAEAEHSPQKKKSRYATDQEAEEEVIGATPSAEKGDAINVVELQEQSMADSGGSVSQDHENTPPPVIAAGSQSNPPAPTSSFHQHEDEASSAVAALNSVTPQTQLRPRRAAAAKCTERLKADSEEKERKKRRKSNIKKQSERLKEKFNENSEEKERKKRRKSNIKKQSERLKEKFNEYKEYIQKYKTRPTEKTNKQLRQWEYRVMVSATEEHATESGKSHYKERIEELLKEHDLTIPSKKAASLAKPKSQSERLKEKFNEYKEYIQKYKTRPTEKTNKQLRQWEHRVMGSATE
eukprot:CAMPEP_0194260948 /NCGR_PEP_ID=MMETSP0158-20130606/45773_1 /TAXON_ID=33649 /ORGANISM="Thalassionema nitzschioides, Strain L26-B" /LENGTH=829 /DNA_ID=CAMNT_0039001053 /DNA_START=55 /DNA_END=2542 /DNA_ORIENTATION=-